MIYSLKKQNKEEILKLFIKYGNIVIVFSVIGEIIFFPSWANVAGCAMAVISWIIFNVLFLKKRIILFHTFSFLAYLSMFLACYIPLPATLIEAKPISYGFQNPLETFFYQTLIFIVASLAFFAVIYKKARRNNYLQKTLYRLNFFNTNPTVLWVLGIIGLFSRIQTLAVVNEVQIGDVGSKFLDGFVYLQYAPLILLFPTLSGVSNSNKGNKSIFVYVIFLVVLSFATNSRQQMIYPLLTILLLFSIYLLKDNISVFSLFSPSKIVFALFFVFFGLGFLSDISLAMLENRILRKDNIDRMELLTKTFETLQQDDVMESLRAKSLENQSSVVTYETTWDENYLNNFMLNRYGNLRVVDETIYYANKIGFANSKMQETFLTKTFAIYPLPILTALGIDVDKTNLDFSPGDMLYFIGTGNPNALGGHRVTSLIGDGLATFGYWCFPIVFVLLFFSFKLMDSFIYFTKTDIVFSTLGLINIFGFFGIFRNSIGCIVPLEYLLRGFFQQCFTFWLLVFIIGRIFGLKKNYKKISLQAINF
ncbi:hypothetical protein [Flavobacterium restrictum]|uniref:O-antigen polysaccharide polymerase Wzy n=1 Tax=Flavobacterium restrictum TaxID=2594428 RepID=A0A553E4Z4_9FLAO|nr:hypothetical protein [Flavobacterium restrictum]TRX40116.1 hypothetical protein FNW21_07865 [Flavobacterium restrictum]